MKQEKSESYPEDLKIGDLVYHEPCFNNKEYPEIYKVLEFLDNGCKLNNITINKRFTSNDKDWIDTFVFLKNHMHQKLIKLSKEEIVKRILKNEITI